MFKPTSGEMHAGSTQSKVPPTLEYTNEYIEGLSPLPATQACTDELAAIMTSESELLPNSPNPDRRLAILFTRWVEMRREQSRTAGPRPNGPTKNDPPELYLGFHLTASEVLLAASIVAPNSLPHSGGNVKDGPNIDILNAGLNVAAYLRSRCMPNSTFLSVWPPAMAAGDLVIYCHKLSKTTRYTVNNDLKQIKEHENIFNTEVIPVKGGEPWKRMMWHFGGSRYHPKRFDYEPFDAQKVLGEKLAEVVARHRPQHNSGSS
ncbi:hypothetical protein C2E23DRAFT_862285 [Lenzites betulinus]|nr:hypothetical protein C2E23DRAFT_862285 [Lenzites betulinus]